MVGDAIVSTAYHDSHEQFFLSRRNCCGYRSRHASSIARAPDFQQRSVYNRMSTRRSYERSLNPRANMANPTAAKRATYTYEILLDILEFADVSTADRARALSVCKSWCVPANNALNSCVSFHEILVCFNSSIGEAPNLYSDIR